ncbi:hypothetical protein PCE1_000251 [Barthelona sp. PCE]
MSAARYVDASKIGLREPGRRSNEEKVYEDEDQVHYVKRSTPIVNAPAAPIINDDIPQAAVEQEQQPIYEPEQPTVSEGRSRSNSAKRKSEEDEVPEASKLRTIITLIIIASIFGIVSRSVFGSNTLCTLDNVRIERGYKYSINKPVVESSEYVPTGAIVLGSDVHFRTETYVVGVDKRCRTVTKYRQMEEYVETIATNDANGYSERDIYRKVDVPYTEEECEEIEVTETRDVPYTIYTYEVMREKREKVFNNGDCETVIGFPSLPEGAYKIESYGKAVLVMIDDNDHVVESTIAEREFADYCQRRNKMFQVTKGLFRVKNIAQL